jgi:hypothetical protein
MVNHSLNWPLVLNVWASSWFTIPKLLSFISFLMDQSMAITAQQSTVPAGTTSWAATPIDHWSIRMSVVSYSFYCPVLSFITFFLPGHQLVLIYGPVNGGQE